MTLSWNGKRFDWVNVGVVRGRSTPARSSRPGPSPGRASALALVLWWLSGSIGICLTYHRLLTHRGFRVPKALEYLGTLAGMLASEGGAISWVAMHRVHHAKSDQPGEDLHTPKDGFLWSHVGWVLCRGSGPTTASWSAAGRPSSSPTRCTASSTGLHWVPNVALGLALYAWGGWSLVVWGMFAAARAHGPRHLVRELRGAHLGLPHLADEGGLAEPLVGRPRRLGRGLAQHAPRLPALRPPRLRPRARPDLAGRSAASPRSASPARSTCCRRTRSASEFARRWRRRPSRSQRELTRSSSRNDGKPPSGQARRQRE